MIHILVADDEAGIRETLSSVLQDEGYRVSVAASLPEAFRVGEADPPDLCLVDVWLGEDDGLSFLDEIGRWEDPPAVVMMSGHGTIETAVRALKAGASDYIEKPFSIDRVLTVTVNALRLRGLERENRALREKVSGRYEMVGISPATGALRELIGRIAPTEGWVLVSGENGTGKELVARAIHEGSSRSRGPFVDVNCAAIPETLIESELFGHEKGAFTGAHARRPGKFEQASGGVLFLDEIGDMALSTQARVLRVLQERSLTRLGGNRSIPLDVRVVAATNRDLSAMIALKEFREDLFYRLNVVSVRVPSLRERREDIPLLVEHFVETLCRDYGHRPKRFSREALEALSSRNWPGNVRELKNSVERLLILAPGPEIGVRDLDPVSSPESPVAVPAVGLSGGAPGERGTGEGVPEESREDLPFREARDRFEREYLLGVLSRCGGNIAKAALRLGMDRTSLHRRIRQWEGEEGKGSGEGAESPSGDRLP
ncbi:MAG: sigma-54-dependent transcriptional regulator [Leptospirillia bacterium]